MAAPTVVRPAQPIRQRDRERERDRAPKPALKRSTNADGGDAPNKKRRMNEPYVRDTDYILRKHRGKPVSLVIHLHNTHFKFVGQEGSFAYDSPMRFLLEHLRKKTVPHEMLEELLAHNVPWYDGCLIVEVHNYRTKEGSDQGRQDSGAGPGADGKFSMHKYNEHVIPSALAPYPSKAQTDGQKKQAEGSSSDTPAPERASKNKEGPRVFTTVLHPTALTQHHELLLLANTPASELRGKKKSADAGTPGNGQPPTPSMSVSPTPVNTSRGPLSQSQKMCLEENDLYSFQADVLLATEPPLFLDPVNTPEDAEKVLDMLSGPLQVAKPPSPKTRKRTTAEMAADDAQAAETERKMLIMDERIKPSARGGTATAAIENQGAAAALGFSRFKTIDMVRQKHEEQERIRKDEETRAAVEKKHIDEQNSARQQQLMAQQTKQREALLAQQREAMNSRNVMAQRQEAIRQHQQMEQQRQAQMAREHAHPQPNQMLQNPQQGNFQQQAQMPQGSPMVKQQTPMVHSSPMMQQGGFPMAQTSSQGAGSPPRPTSALMQQNRNVAMARQASQQQGSAHNTPQIPQGTPNMPQAMPNRQTTQTPRLPPGSPAGARQGTPNSAHMPLQPTPHMGQPNQFTPEQMAMLQRQQSMRQSNAAGSPAGGDGSTGGGAMQNMTPEQFQAISVQGQARMRFQQQQLLAAQQQGNQQAVHQLRMQLQQQQQQVAHMRRMQQMQQAGQMQQHMGGGQAGSPGVPQQHMGQGGQMGQTPQMGHGHPPQTPHPGHPQQQQALANPQHQQMSQQQQQHMQQQQQQQGPNGQMATADQIAQAQARSQQMAFQRQAQTQIQQLGSQYGGWQNIPPPVLAGLPQPLQLTWKGMLARIRREQAARAMQAQAMQQQQQQQANNGGMGGGNNNSNGGAGMGGMNNNGGAGGGGGEVVPGGAGNPQYMQALRSNRDALAAQMQMQGQQQQGGNSAAALMGMPGQMGGGGGMQGMAGPGQQFGGGGAGQQNSDGLSQHFANMQNALNRPGMQ